MEVVSLAPICLFTYNRLDETKQTIEALKANFLAKESILYIFSDGWKTLKDKNSILFLRDYLHTISGFKEVHIYQSNENKGLAKSIIFGVSKILKIHESVIVLEDDLITSPNFLDFMNQALFQYYCNEMIFSISGYTLDLLSLSNLEEDYYLGVRASSWGWGTWRRSWNNIDWEINDYIVFLSDSNAKKYFSLGGSDMLGMLNNQMKGKIDSWAIRWCYNQSKRKQYTIFPKISKIQSIGFSDKATHTKNGKRFITKLDNSNQRLFKFPTNVKINEKLINEFKNKFSLLNRIISKFNI